MTIDRIVAAGLMRGLTRADAETMTLGMWIDFIIEYNELTREGQKEQPSTGAETSKHASQADFDKF